MRSTGAIADELATTSSSARRRLLRDELLHRAARMSTDERSVAAQALASAGIASPLPAPALGVGEAWLLTHRQGRGGAVHRVRAGWRRTPPGAPLDRLEIERAYRGLLAAAGRAMRRLPHAAQPAIGVDLAASDLGVEGSSLGLSAAIAALSAIVGRPPTPATAGSAQVLEDGSLRPVAYLTAKAAALRDLVPAVSTLVVAEGQRVEEVVAASFRVVRAGRLDEAFAHFGVDLGALDAFGFDAHRQRIAAAELVGEAALGADDWLRRAEELWESAAAVEADAPALATEARIRAAHFALHAGRPDLGDAWIQAHAGQIADDSPEVRVFADGVLASGAIDRDAFDEAHARARSAVAGCDALPAPTRRQLRGIALGTHGRVHMHAGDLDAAEPLLREALAHHEAHLPLQAPRSACYLATCLRLQGRFREALAVIDGALDRIVSRADRPRLLDTTELFARLERGRVLALVGRLEEARRDLEVVLDAQDFDGAYPRLGALRDLADVYRALGEAERAEDALRRCVQVVESAAAPMVRRVAAIAVGRAIEEGWATSLGREALEAAWARAFEGGERGEARGRRLRGFVY